MTNSPGSTHTCLSCGQAFTGTYCNTCGEKVYTEKDKSIIHFFEEGFHFITHFEGKFFRTLKVVIAHPGKLSLDYCAGIRKKYVKPLTLFLLLVVIYLLFPLAAGLNMPMDYYKHTGGLLERDGIVTIFAPAQIEKKMQARHLNDPELSNRFAERSEKMSKILLIAIVPLSALILWGLYTRKKKLFFDHLVLSTEISAGFLFYMFMVVPIPLDIFIIIAKPYALLRSEKVVGLIEATSYYCVMLPYSFFALRNFYQEKWYFTLLKAVVFTVLYGEIIFSLYKFLLFETTMMTI